MDIQDFIVREKARCDSFRLLAACFYEPQKDVFQDESLLLNLSTALRHICNSAANYAEEMDKALSMYSEEDLLVDYARLFVGPSELLAPPYGSVYLDGSRRIMGDSTMEVIDFYNSHGLVIDEDFKEVPDHITVELEFMYYLIFNEIQAIEASDTGAAVSAMQAQAIFLNHYLKPWVEKLAEKMSTEAETAFYRALAGCLYSFIYKTDVPNLPENLKPVAVL